MGSEPYPTEGSTRSPEGGLVGRGRQGFPRSSGDSMPAHLQDLLDRGTTHLDGEERVRLASLLVEFQGTFTGSPDWMAGSAKPTGSSTPTQE